MLTLGGCQTAKPLRDRIFVAFPLKPLEDPSVGGGTTALFLDESGISCVVDDPPVLGAWPHRSLEQELERAKTLKPAELTAEPVAARWIVSYLRFLCPAALEDVNRSQSDRRVEPSHEEQGPWSH